MVIIMVACLLNITLVLCNVTAVNHVFCLQSDFTVFQVLPRKNFKTLIIITENFPLKPASSIEGLGWGCGRF